MTNSPLIPAHAGTQTSPSSAAPTKNSLGPRVRGDERLLGLALTFLATPALAHDGHHETLTLAEQARHLLTQPDHILAFAGLVVLAVVGAWQWRRVKAKARK